MSTKGVTSVVYRPKEKKTIGFDWTERLTDEGTSISTYELSAPYGITILGHSETGGVVTVLLSATRAGQVDILAKFVDGQEDPRTMTIRYQK